MEAQTGIRMEGKWILIVAVAFIAMIVIGEAVAYGGGYSYDSSAERSGDIVSYSVSSSGSNDYTAVLIDNHGFSTLEKLVIYVDDDYVPNYRKASDLSMVYESDPSYYADQIKRMLEIRSFKDVIICDGEGLIDFVNETIANPGSCGILSVSYSLPGEIYSGSAEDKLMKWIDGGGSLYWVGSIPGEFYYDSDGKLIQVSDSQELFFGASDCTNPREEVDMKLNDNEYTRSLSLISEFSGLGLDISKLKETGRKYLAMGILDGDYSSYTFVEYGGGMVVQFAGPFKIVQTEDIAQMIASRICIYSTIVAYEGERVTRTTEQGSFESSDGDILYVYIGRNYSVYGRAWDV